MLTSLMLIKEKLFLAKDKRKKVKTNITTLVLTFRRLFLTQK